jgi:NAD(P)-dependent dehydrogenase (short-subunit alcohol dehydrogenase family)
LTVVVVTGATGAVGLATCAALRASGHIVVAVGTHETRLAGVQACTRIVCDLTDEQATNDLAAEVREKYGRTDAVVHLVGGWRGGHDDTDWNWLEPRILTTLRLTTLAFFDDLSGSSAGRLVTIGSTSAGKPTWSGANYATLKTAASAWMASIASGWRKAGTAAAIELLVRSIGDDGTPADQIADRILALIDGNATELNGSRIDLTVA